MSQVQGYSVRAKQVVFSAWQNRRSEAAGLSAIDIARALTLVDGPLRHVLGLDPLVGGGDNSLPQANLSSDPPSNYSLDGARLLDAAAHEAGRLSATWIEPEHLLIAMVRSRDEAGDFITEHTSLRRRDIKDRVLSSLGREAAIAYRASDSIRRPWDGPLGVAVTLVIITAALTVAAWLQPTLRNYLVADHHEIAQGQLYRLITAMFVHRDVWHLAGNMLLLAWFGPTVEALLGRWTGAAAYFVTGAVATAISYAFECVTGAGASVAAFGFIGIVVGYAIGRRVTLKERLLGLIPLGLAAALIVIDASRPSSGADSLAHLAGLGAGVLIGLAVGFRPTTWPLSVVLAEATVVAVTVVAGPFVLPDPCTAFAVTIEGKPPWIALG